ncbi:FAD-dependent oxidoreductase [Microbacterium binotii]|uniref:FAD-dependent oxidoreductase n=1 Tax=Microbacterium binotii TaxID=462710 RepID=UPI001F1A4177|nr:FAD-dependent oxidoreductase [Microbacterium binotii]UIN29978.1 FAD-dependent oxidoreductase [Microbacterium binotii]
MESLWKQHARTVPATPFVPGEREIVVVGAGITGLATALLLAESGREVVVLEAREVAGLATGANTGKVSLLQGTQLSALRSHHSPSLVRAYVQANQDGQLWLRSFADRVGLPYEARSAFTYAQHDAGRARVREEFEAAREAGLPVRWAAADELDLPFPARFAVALDGQLGMDPDAAAHALASAFLAAGGTLHTGVRATGVSTSGRPTVHTARGDMTAESVVLATGAAVLDRGLYFAKVSAMRSYAVAFAVPEEVALPEGMFLSADAPSRSVRTVSERDGRWEQTRLIVGGGGHPVGRAASERARIAELIAWTRRHVPEAVPTHRWSAQDYTSHNLIPFVGVMPRTGGRVRFATGYAKWGLTNGPAAALRIAAEIEGVGENERADWMRRLGTRITVPADLATGAAENAKVGGQAVQGWVGALRHPPRIPSEGKGVVGADAGRPVGVSRVDGEVRAVSAVCPHLGGVLKWNDAECTWDCPLHASRFSPDGRRIEGPALSDLRRLRPPSSAQA